MGWSLEENPVVSEPDLDAMALEQARLAYADKFGAPPHHRMKLDSIIEKLNGNESL